MSAYWLVWDAENGTESDARKIAAGGASDAAEEWARKDDYESVEFSIAHGNDALVFVRDYDHREATPMRFVVSGESSPVYTARRNEP
jgi:hypothetical protein